MGTTSNPVLARAGLGHLASSTARRMTLAGTLNKTWVLLGILCATATFAWMQIGGEADASDHLGTLFLMGVVGGLAVALFTCYRPDLAPITAPMYAALEGLLLGAVSARVSAEHRGLPTQAVLLTVMTLTVMLLLYRARVIRPTERLRTIVVSCTSSIAAFYLIAIALAFFGLYVPFLHEGGALGIGFSLCVATLAAFNLVLDFNAIERRVGQAPEYMEWFCAFGLLVTLVWLYLEMLRLLRKVRR